MRLPLRDALVPKLGIAFPGMAFSVGTGDEPLVTFPAKHPAVGSVSIDEDLAELTIHIGSITHRHFSSQWDVASAADQAEDIALQVIGYLQLIFSDNLEFYGNGRSGGARERSDKPRGWLSRLVFGSTTYVWSGPIS